MGCKNSDRKIEIFTLTMTYYTARYVNARAYDFYGVLSVKRSILFPQQLLIVIVDPRKRNSYPLRRNRQTIITQVRSDTFGWVPRKVFAGGRIGIHTIHTASLSLWTRTYLRTCSVRLRYHYCRVVARVVHVYYDFTQCHCCRTRA